MKKWKRSYGDGYETDDLVLWENDKPTDTAICHCSGYYVLLKGNERLMIADTIKEIKAEYHL